MLYLLNKDLSLEAKGLLSIMLHLQDGEIEAGLEAALHYSNESYAALSCALRELQNHGYVIMQERNERNLKVAILENNSTSNEIKE